MPKSFARSAMFLHALFNVNLLSRSVLLETLIVSLPQKMHSAGKRGLMPVLLRGDRNFLLDDGADFALARRLRFLVKFW